VEEGPRRPQNRMRLASIACGSEDADGQELKRHRLLPSEACEECRPCRLHAVDGASPW